MQHTCFIQRWSLRACCALAARLLCVCCAVATRSPRGHCTALVAALSLNVRRAGSACTCAGILPISFGSAHSGSWLQQACLRRAVTTRTAD